MAVNSMHPNRLSLSLVALSLASVLAACNKTPQPAVDFSPAPASAAAPAISHIGNHPSELALQERKLPLTAVRECNLERVNGKVFTGTPVEVARDADVVLSGWVVDAASTSVPTKVTVRLVGMTDNRAWKVEAHTGARRDDVKTLLGGNAAYATPGFAVTLDPSALPPGTYRAYVVFDGNSGTKACDNGRGITIE